MSNDSKIILFALIASLFVNQAFSMQCYSCASDTGEECDNNPAQKENVLDCTLAAYMSTKSDNYSSLLSAMSSIQLNSTALGPANYALSYDCITLRGRDRDGTKGVVRSCSLASNSCKYYKDMLKPKGFKVDTCQRCYSNLCNSSDNLKIGKWSFVVTLILALALMM